MMTKEQFINWFEKGEECRQTLLQIEALFGGNSIFESPLGRFYDEYIDMPNFSEDAKELIGEFIWWGEDIIHWYFNETEYFEIKTLEELYYVVMELSYMENMKEQIDYLLSNVNYFSCVTLWFPGYSHESVNTFELTIEQTEKIVNELNNYIRTCYPERNVVVHYDNEKFNLWNDECEYDD